MVAETILENYGEIDVMADDRCFFSVLIEDQRETNKRALPAKQNANRITFVKKVG